jgi:hypothetical protein
MKKREVSLNAPISKVHDWPSLFEQIRLRPGMWLDKDSITALSNLKAGIELAELFHEVPDDKAFGGFDFDAFYHWVTAKYNPHKLSLDTFGLARYVCKTERDAFDKWYEWYDEFRSFQKNT